jgi:threonine dehydrogenase-like Zn-dependent dehydrogenase
MLGDRLQVLSQLRRRMRQFMGHIETRAFWVTAPGQGEIRSETIGDALPGQVRIRTLYSGISRGTECLVFNGKVPRSEFSRMRAPHQEGDFPAPVKYGYNSVGIVEQGPPAWRDRAVFCLYPHQGHYIVPIEDAHALPPHVPPRRAVLAANLETALNGLWDAAPAAGSAVTVIGAGSVGCLAAWLAHKQADAAVQVVDIDARKQRIVEALGLDFALTDSARPGAQTIIHTSGSPEGLRTALSLAGFEATVIEMSWFGTTPVTLPLGEAFHSQRLTIRSSQVGVVAGPMRERIDRRDRMKLCLEMLGDPSLDCLIDRESRFEDLPQVMHELSSGRDASTCHRINYS